MAKARALVGITILLLANLVTTVQSTATTTPATVKEPVEQVVVKQPSPVRKKIKHTPETSRSYARSTMLKEYGWGPKQYFCLNKIWTRESHWNHKANNPTSSAQGIPQILGLTTKDPKQQVNKGLRYIQHRYDTPCKAWSFWQKNHWY